VSAKAAFSLNTRVPYSSQPDPNSSGGVRAGFRSRSARPRHANRSWVDTAGDARRPRPPGVGRTRVSPALGDSKRTGSDCSEPYARARLPPGQPRRIPEGQTTASPPDQPGALQQDLRRKTGELRGELAEPFNTILSRPVRRRTTVNDPRVDWARWEASFNEPEAPEEAPDLNQKNMVGGTGLEPVTPSLSSWCSPN
jgi:hypothetical protein